VGGDDATDAGRAAAEAGGAWEAAPPDHGEPQALGAEAPGHPEREPETDCADGLDNDSDRLIDCEDGDCPTEDCLEICSDGEDNDRDGLLDCEDDDCWGREDCPTTVRLRGGQLRLTLERTLRSEESWSQQRAWMEVSSAWGSGRAHDTTSCSWTLDSALITRTASYQGTLNQIYSTTAIGSAFDRRGFSAACGLRVTDLPQRLIPSDSVVTLPSGGLWYHGDAELLSSTSWTTSGSQIDRRSWLITLGSGDIWSTTTD
jgi:hypothetical protein